jgi:molecular chaperone GrpE
MAAEDVPPPAEAPPDEPPAVEPGAPTEDSPPAEEDWASRFKYLLADFENFRKRSSKEREKSRLEARASVIGSLLPLHEAAARAREAVAKLPPTDPVRRGVELLGQEWQSFLEREGVVPVARVGTSFRAEWHEAVAEAPPRANAPEGSVLEIVQQGYRIGTILLRPAKVVVARSTPSARDRPTEAEAAVGPDAPESI